MQAISLKSWRRRIVVACFITYACYYLGRVNLAVTVPALRQAFGWDKATIGVIGTAFYWAYAAGQLVNGPLGDRVSPRRLVAVGLVASALLNLAFGSLGGALPWLFTLWALNGWAQATGWAPIIRTLSRWFEPAQRARVTAIIGPSYLVGHAASWALAGALTARLGWRYAYWVPGVLLMGAAALWYSLARDEPGEALAEDTRTPARGGASLLAGMGAAWRGPMRWAAAVSLLSGMVKEGLNLWGPTYLVEEQSLGVLGAALGGLLIPTAGIAGQIVTGRVQQGVARGRERPVVAGLGVVVAVGAAALYLTGGGRSLSVALLMLGLVAAGSHGMNGLLMASLPLSLGSRAPVSAITGALNFCQYLGAGLGAALVGALVDRLGWGGAYGWWAGCALLIALVAAIGMRRRRAAGPLEGSPAA
jgi:sugar phosphate permease